MGPYLNDHLWKVIEKCWQQEPKDRPTMKHVLDFFTSLSPKSTEYDTTPYSEQGRLQPVAHREVPSPSQLPQSRAQSSKPQHGPMTATNAATRNTILGMRSLYGDYSAEKAGEAAAVPAAGGSTARGHDRDRYVDGAGFARADTPSDGGGVAGDEGGRVARARYSFDGREDGELPLRPGTEVHILDDRDPA
jgi:hypothetical protein